MAFKSSSVINLVDSYKATKYDSNTVYYFSDPTTVGCFSLSLSLPLQILPISTFNISTNGKQLKQDVLKQPEANTDLLLFSVLSYYKSSVENNFSYICYRIFALGLSC